MFRLIISEKYISIEQFFTGLKKLQVQIYSCFWKKQSKLRSDTKVYQLHSVVCQTFELWYWPRPVWRVGRPLTLVRSWCYLKEYFLLSFLCWSRMFYNNYSKFNVQCLYESIWIYLFSNNFRILVSSLRDMFWTLPMLKKNFFMYVLTLTLPLKNCVYLLTISWQSCKKISFHAILKFREEGQPSVVFQTLHFYTSKVIFSTFWHSLDQVIQFSSWGDVSSTKHFFWEPIQLAKVLLIIIWYLMIFFSYFWAQTRKTPTILN